MMYPFAKVDNDDCVWKKKDLSISILAFLYIFLVFGRIMQSNRQSWVGNDWGLESLNLNLPTKYSFHNV